MFGQHHQLNGHEFEQTPGDSEGQGSLACCNPWSHKESDVTQSCCCDLVMLLFNNNLYTYLRMCILCQIRRHKRHGFNPWVGKIPWRRAWPPIVEFLPGESHGQRSMARTSSQGLKELDTIEATQHADITYYVCKCVDEYMYTGMCSCIYVHSKHAQTGLAKKFFWVFHITEKAEQTFGQPCIFQSLFHSDKNTI